VGTIIQPKFHIGDIVRLYSGSPRMTVVELSGQRVTCAWFVDQLLHCKDFDADALTIDEKGSKQ
jgi:uncharacterized protein YodC (DUF2158 family)